MIVVVQSVVNIPWLLLPFRFFFGNEPRGVVLHVVAFESSDSWLFTNAF